MPGSTERGEDVRGHEVPAAIRQHQHKPTGRIILALGPNGDGLSYPTRSQNRAGGHLGNASGGTPPT